MTWRQRNEWVLFGAFWQASRSLTTAWWALLVLRALAPVGFAVATGFLITAVQDGQPLTWPLLAIGLTCVAPLLLSPVHTAVSNNLGDRTAAWLNEQLALAAAAPEGIGHLEDERLTGDLVVARDFDLGVTGPPLAFAVDMIAGGLIEMLAGLASAALLTSFRWWAGPLLAGCWLATHYLLRESGVWRGRHADDVRLAQRSADYLYRLAVDPPAAKELRLFGLSGWVLERFHERRMHLHELQYNATRLRQRPVLGSLLLVLAGNLLVFGAIGWSALDGLGLGPAVVFAQAAVGTSLIAFGGLNWALDGAAAPVAAVGRLRAAMTASHRLTHGSATVTGPLEIRFRDVTFAYPGAAGPVLDHFNLTIPAGRSIAIVGRNGAGKTTIAKLLSRLYDPQSGRIEVNGVDLRELDLDAWRRLLTAVFQDFTRFELSLRDNVAPGGAPDADIRAALTDAGGDALTELDTVLSKSYAGGTDLSGGQWQRVALARSLCRIRGGAALVLLDEPTANLDVRGELEIFNRVLEATRGHTTVLVSHRFSTVRQADLICVLENGQVTEVGSHAELIARRGSYQEMFELQAQAFAADDRAEGRVGDVLG